MGPLDSGPLRPMCPGSRGLGPPGPKDLGYHERDCQTAQHRPSFALVSGGTAVCDQLLTGVTAAAVAASESTILNLTTFEVIAANLAISGIKESDLTGSGLTGAG